MISRNKRFNNRRPKRCRFLIICLIVLSFLYYHELLLFNHSIRSSTSRRNLESNELEDKGLNRNIMETINQCREKRSMTDVLFITSITRPFRDHAYKRNWKHTIWWENNNQKSSSEETINDDDYKPFLLWIFNENIWEIQHGREPLTMNDFPFVDCMLDIFEVMPNALSDIAAIDAFYRLEGTPGLNTFIMDGKVLMRKVAAIAFMLGIVKDENMVIWLDVDVQLIKPLDEIFLNFVRSKDISYLPETTCWRDLLLEDESSGGGFGSLPQSCLDFRVDTGIIAFRTNERTRSFTNWWMEAYSSKPGRMLALARMCLANVDPSDNEAQELIRYFTRNRNNPKINSAKDLCELPQIMSNLGLNDIYTFALGLHAFGDEIKHGWLADQSNYCEENVIHSPDQEQPKLPGGHCYVCSSATARANHQAGSLVSPFTARRYLAHVKRGTGIMARQHMARSEPEIKEVRTKDKELILPPEYFPISSHIDHRLACGDKRSKYGQIWSLHQIQKRPST